MATVDEAKPIPPEPPRRGWSRALRIVAVRSRFLAVFAVVFAVLGGWETIRSYWGKWTAGSAGDPAISSDTEYFCPMDPGVLSDWPSKCPVCNMTLVRRERGEATPLPDGVVARMQLTPYRLTLGGIATATADYAPLARTIDLPGTVEGEGRIEAEAFARELDWIEDGRSVEILPVDGRSGISIPGRIGKPPSDDGARSVGKLVVTVESPPGPLRAGEKVRVRVNCPVDRLEPFRSQPSAPPPLSPGEPRKLFGCMEHLDVLLDAAGRCPRDGSELMPRPIRADQRIRWWCPMHPSVVADRRGDRCGACGGMELVPRVVSFRPPGKVLAIPASAAIDDGSRSIVFVERGPGMFDARVVTLGPRCDGGLPVASGLEPGERVVAQGAFLLDAETRLDPSLAAGYFGAVAAHSAARPGPEPHSTSHDPSWLEGLTSADRPRALQQSKCPVTNKPLGSMGVPPKVKVRGRDVFLCCQGCSGAVVSEPEKYLAKVPAEGKP